MKYRKLTKKEEEATLIQIMDTLLDDSIPYSGAHRHKQWEKGWGENLKSMEITPKYFGKYPINRLNGEFVYALDKNYEVNKLYELVDALGKKYLSKVDAIYEFGCGTGHNLLRMRKINPDALFVGCDWATSSQKILNSYPDPHIKGYHFDFFDPGNLGLKKNSGVYTVAALEQTGKDYVKFVKYLLRKKPSIVVHIEPIPELLDPTNLLDYLSIKYMQKRRYLSGYLDYLRELEKKGKIKIIEARRSGVGSLFVDGYSILIWKPL